MANIVALWAVPRSTSTAFEWMMRQRGDITCLHEPFGEAWYQGEVPLWPRVRDDSLRVPGLTLESVWDTMRNLAKKGPVFSKDFPHYIDHMWDDEMLSHFTHSFLIRNPAMTITSMSDKWPDFHEKEVGFAEQRELFERLMDKTGSPPPVIDSDDLLENPDAIVSAFCNSVGIPFLPKAMSWKAGKDPSAHSWWDGGSFHANLAQSTGLKPQIRRYVDIADTPERVQRVYMRMKPHYEHLYQHRIKAVL